MKSFRRLLTVSIILLACWELNAQTPVRNWTGNFAAGFALTDGNTDTNSLNLSFGLSHDPRNRNIVRFNGLYLRGDKDGTSIVDRTTLTLRNEYAMTPRVFLFGQNEYLRDKFKEIDYLISPTSGVGYRLINTDAFLLSFDTSLGGIWEKNTRKELSTHGAMNAGQRIQWKISPMATFTQSATSLYQLNSFSDALYNLGLGLASSITPNIELKVEILDSYKTRPPDPAIQKNDLAFVTSFGFKF